MGSSGKKKTTMAKLMRESRLREHRAKKQVRKDARKLAATQASDRPDGLLITEPGESPLKAAERPDAELVIEPLAARTEEVHGSP